MGVPAFHGAIVQLAPLRDDDSALLLEWINDRSLVTMSAPFQPVSPVAHEAWFDAVRRRDDMRIFGIRLLDGDRLVGSCQLHSIHPAHKSAELQIRVGARDAWGRGVGHEATNLLLRFGFEHLALHRIYLHVFATNDRALRLYHSVGFRHEGVLREAARVEGAWMNVLLLAILQAEHAER
jgi:RimJ/RimL family protein N-acetyltransferase